MLGPSVGILLAALVTDRLERRLTLIGCTLAMACFGVAFAAASELPLLIAIGFAFTLSSALFSAILSLYGAEMFPTGSRASVTAFAWGAGRLVSIAVAPVLLALLTARGPAAMCAAITAAALAMAALLIFAGPPGPGRRAIG